MIPWAPRALFGARSGRVPRRLKRAAARWLAQQDLASDTPRPYPRALAVPLTVPMTGTW